MPNSVLPLKKTKQEMPFLSLPEFLIWKMRPASAVLVRWPSNRVGEGALIIVFALSTVSGVRNGRFQTTNKKTLSMIWKETCLIALHQESCVWCPKPRGSVSALPSSQSHL